MSSCSKKKFKNEHSLFLVNMLYAFELSGEHPDLPRAEVLACLEMEGLEYREHSFFDQCLVVDIEGSDEQIVEKLGNVAHRVALGHNILRVAGICDTDMDSIIEMADECDLSAHIEPGQTYVVRAKRIGHHSDIRGENLEGRVGGSIYRKGFRANLKEPDVKFRLILTEKCVLGSVIGTIDRSAYEQRSPQKKPFFYPGVLMPRIARALVNISKVRSGEIFFDPFCGTAGILVEAGLVGAKAIGLDVQSKIIYGARMNMDFFDLENLLIQADACRVPLVDSCANAIVTDPPYGRSAAIKAESLNHLYEGSFKEMYRVLKSGGLAVVVSEQPVETFARDAGFVMQEQYLQKVHKSLTRIISIFKKE